MFGIGIPEIIVLLILFLPFALWIWALVDIARSEFAGSEKVIWLLVVIFTYLLGVIIYYLVGTRHKLSSRPMAGMQQVMVFCTGCGGELQPLAQFCPRCGVRQPVREAGSNANQTLVAVIVVVVLGFTAIAGSGIIAAIAIPSFASYRLKAFNATAKADIRNARTALESYYTDHRSYPETLEQAGFQPSKQVLVTMEQRADGSWLLAAHHLKGNRTYTVTTGAAEIQEEVRN
jgi:type IV pilus assembly protein PilA